MSEIAKPFFATNPALGFPIAALVIFMCVFVMISYRAIRARKGELEQLSHLPLQD